MMKTAKDNRGKGETMKDMGEKMMDELTRVGFNVIEVEGIGDSVTVTIDGWPDPITYSVDRAMPVLAATSTGAARTAEGDADLCRRLDDADAVVMD